jgi:heat shock protein HtpX
MRIHILDRPQNEEEAWLVEIVRDISERAKIGMPEVGLFDSPDPNAFATGARRDHALVAVSSGLLRTMDRREIEAVLGHEIAHVANGDMVTMALLQGVLNTFVIFLARVVGIAVDQMVFRQERGHGPGYWVTNIVLQIVLGVFATLIVMWFSRRREFRADEGGAELCGRGSMISALRRLLAAEDVPSDLPDSLRAFGVRSGPIHGLFRSHPPLEVRIAALEQRHGETHELGDRGRHRVGQTH